MLISIRLLSGIRTDVMRSPSILPFGVAIAIVERVETSLSALMRVAPPCALSARSTTVFACACASGVSVSVGSDTVGRDCGIAPVGER